MEERNETRDEGRERMWKRGGRAEEDFLSVTAAPIPPLSFSQKIKYWSISQAY